MVTVTTGTNLTGVEIASSLVGYVSMGFSYVVSLAQRGLGGGNLGELTPLFSSAATSIAAFVPTVGENF